MKPRGCLILTLLVVTTAACSSGKSSSPPAAPSSTTTTVSPTKGLIANIDHIVVLMQENRSFDSYFSQLEGQEPPTTGNPDPTDKTGPPILPFHNPKMCETEDLAHGWNAVHEQINGGKMDGFTATNTDPTDPTGSRAMAYYGPGDLPFYYALARTFGIGDRYFSSVPGPTYPNRYFLIAGTSFGHIRNTIPTGEGWTQKTIFEELDAAHVSWKIYNSQVSVEGFLFEYVRKHAKGHVVGIDDYYADAAAGTLPQVAFVEPTFIGTAAVRRRRAPAREPAARAEVQREGAQRVDAEPELVVVGLLPDLGRARRRVRPRGAAGGAEARRHRADAREGRYCGRIRPVRRARAGDRRLTVVAARAMCPTSSTTTRASCGRSRSGSG